MSRSIIVLGAGAVGVCTALALRRRGLDVILIDRKPPASETSAGNAGTLCESSAIPFNNPSLFGKLPSLFFNRTAALHCDWGYVMTHLPRLLRFLSHANAASTERRATALHGLIAHSRIVHEEWAAACDLSATFHRNGWLQCYRDRRRYDKTAANRALWRKIHVAYTEMDAAQIRAAAPALQADFVRAVHLSGAGHVVNPQRLIRAYADWFVGEGGQFVQAAARSLKTKQGGWAVSLDNGETVTADAAVVALGPWSDDLLKTVGIRLPFIYEYGGNRHFAVGDAPTLTMPLLDADAGYIAVMQETTLRITSGVYLSGRFGAHLSAPLDLAEKAVRRTIRGLGDVVGDDWYGARPMLPDSLPVIGPCRQTGLWLAGGHQHIGLMTAAGGGDLLADWMSGETPSPLLGDFSPTRFGV